MASISIRNITKVFPNGTEAVKDFNLEIADREFIVFVGPSGCGKTTVLRMVAGLEEPTSGEILIDGKTVNDLPPKDRNISMVFQSYALFPHLTVYENIAFGLRARKTPKAEIDALVKKAASVLSIDHLLSRKPKQLSGGERQRVAMGRAIVRNPNVFLMDEPLANLDALLRVEMRAELSLLHSQLKGTFVFVTHDQIEAMTLADRIVVMKSGVVQQVGTPKEIYNNPINKFVAGFIGSPQMNFIKCGEGVEAGIRPEAVVVHEQDDAEGRRIKCRVEITELLGQEIILYLHIEDADFEKKFEINYLKDKKIIASGDTFNDASDIASESASGGTSTGADISEVTSGVTSDEKKTDEKKSETIKLVARVKPDSNLKVGDTVFVEFDEKKLCYFDAKTGERIHS